MKKSKQNKKKGQNFAWSFVIVCFLLSGAVLLNMVSTNGKKVVQKNDKVINEGQDKEKKVVIQDNKYQYDSIELSYVLENQKNVVYITKNGVKKVLLSDVIYNAPGESEPKFYKTDKANIALLESGLGDMGSLIIEYYYIDLFSEKVLSTINNNGLLTVNGTNLSFDISDNCGTGADRVAGKAYLNKLLVDGSAKYNFNPEIQLTCVNPDGFGSIYEPEPLFNFKSADVEQGKVYFSVLQNSFSFNISDKSITEDELWSLYSNSKYGFEFLYPSYWSTSDKSEQLNFSIFENEKWGGVSGGIFVGPMEIEPVDSFFIKMQQRAVQARKYLSENSGRPQTVIMDPEMIYIDNEAVIKLEQKPYEIAPNGTLYFFPKYGFQVYVTDLYGDGTNSSSYTELVSEKFLNSFHFLDSQDLTNDWQTYTNTKYGFEFKYPNTFLLEEATENNYGTIANLKFFDREAKNFEGKNIPGYFTYMTISYWGDINNEYARGGSWMGQRHYSSLEDMFTDDKGFIKKEAAIEFAGIKAYKVIVGGYYVIYGIMFEHNNGVYRIDFPEETQNKPNVSVREELISTFKFLDK